MRTVTIGTQHFVVGDENAAYWDAVMRKEWETETYQVLDSFVDANTTLIDIGAWIGPISLYGARIARRVVSVEPDPVAYAKLQSNFALNPDITNCTLLNVAVGTERGTLRLGVRDQPGDSTSSVMLSHDSDGWDVKSITLDDLMASIPLDERVFFKVDIEGFEFALLPHIVRVSRLRNAPVYLSVHPHFIAVSGSPGASGRGFLRKLRRSVRKRTVGRLKAVRAIRQFVRALDGTMDVVDEAGAPLDTKNWVRRVAKRRNVTDTGAVVLLPRFYSSNPI